jgi:hypothetical protein
MTILSTDLRALKRRGYNGDCSLASAVFLTSDNGFQSIAYYDNNELNKKLLQKLPKLRRKRILLLYRNQRELVLIAKNVTYHRHRSLLLALVPCREVFQCLQNLNISPRRRQI